jgi:hypothetical protein
VTAHTMGASSEVRNTADSSKVRSTPSRPGSLMSDVAVGQGAGPPIGTCVCTISTFGLGFGLVTLSEV